MSLIRPNEIRIHFIWRQEAVKNPTLLKKRWVVYLDLRRGDFIDFPEQVALAIKTHPPRGEDLGFCNMASWTFFAQRLDIGNVIFLWRISGSKPALALKVCLFEAEFDDDMTIALLVPVISDMDIWSDAVAMRDLSGALDVVLSC